MEIKRFSSPIGQNVTRLQEMEPTGEDSKTDSTKGTSSPETSDRVHFSIAYQQINKAKKVTMDLGDIRSERVDQIRNLTENNLYTVDAEKVAGIMLDELL